MNIDKIKAKRDAMKSQLAELDAKIEKAKKDTQAARHKEIISLINKHNISASRLREILQREDEAKQMPLALPIESANPADQAQGE
ncbi:MULTISPECIES: hypothetical protein [Diaphorobacter]|uniref:DUF4315 family protein n=1 Tax=Acidovorax ebreus (strain TPSY) TaxID=535289 RepID=A0A9J9Q8Y7_ACIET|nr:MULTISPECIES: hypothetical protein [Diaphorobacter]ACM33029.1 hypothetical protein Dtpsy_1569 [[Acidovorax] ebreus TPSY]